jgi:hypothetical protein
VNERALQREGRTHHREHVCRHVRFYIRAEARQDAVIKRLLNRWHAVAHRHLDRSRDRQVTTGVRDLAHRPVGELRGVDVNLIRAEQTGRVDGIDAGGAEIGECV